MKKKIAILGSTGSIGKTLINIIDKDIKNFNIILLSAKRNHNELLRQAKKYKVKNIILTDKKSFNKLKSKTKFLNINLYNDFENFNKIFKKKIDYIMSSITGIDGLKPTIDSIKYTKKIAIANKEAIICGWNLIHKELKKNKTEFVPVDSEHFSIWYSLKNNSDDIEKIFLTASGGPFVNLPLEKFKNINVKQALNHPNWKMGNKITIDSATMINKVFEVIEAKKIFNLKFKKLSILVHPKSYIHAIVKFKNGMIKIIAHDTDMKIPIFNSLYNFNNFKKIKSKKIDLNILNNLNLNKPNIKKFPALNILNNLPEKNSLFETILVSANDELVNSFLKKKIRFIDISKKLFVFIRSQKYNIYKKKAPKSVNEILKLSKYVRLKISKESI